MSGHIFVMKHSDGVNVNGTNVPFMFSYIPVFKSIMYVDQINNYDYF
jgi:hypothetical protein